MAISSLPLPESTTPHYRYNILLDNIEYVLTYSYSTRNLCWYLSILLKDDTPLLVNLRISPQVDMLAPYAKESIPKGKLVCYPNSIPSPQITLENLASEFKLLYVTD